jgi:hypothetical protein
VSNEGKERAMRQIAGVSAAIWISFVAAGCGSDVSASAPLQVESLASGWVPVEVAPGHSKIVPALSFQLRNVSARSTGAVQVNAIFHRGTDSAEWGNAFQTAAGSSGIGAGASTGHIVLTPHQGYTGSDGPADLLENSKFVDARVDLYSRAGAEAWTKIGEFPVTRVLLNP